jgi:hypothetical protein
MRSEKFALLSKLWASSLRLILSTVELKCKQESRTWREAVQAGRNSTAPKNSMQ